MCVVFERVCVCVGAGAHVRERVRVHLGVTKRAKHMPHWHADLSIARQGVLQPQVRLCNAQRLHEAHAKGAYAILAWPSLKVPVFCPDWL